METHGICFGTDGIRGIFGKDITAATAWRVGYALSSVADGGKILVGTDNRVSSPCLAAALICGAQANGSAVEYIKLATTPALAMLTPLSQSKYGVIITASHNPPEYNGVKIFNSNGYKIDAATRRRIEELSTLCPVNINMDLPLPQESFMLDKYIDKLTASIGDLEGVKIVIDTACGVGGIVASCLQKCGAKVMLLNTDMSGKFVNIDCGATCPDGLAREVVWQKADLGIALDGDADRIIAVTEKGEIINGDMMLYILARYMKEQGALINNTVVATVMTNTGILKSLTAYGINVLSCAVGDYNVTTAMRSGGYSLGGEQSGHIIIGENSSTGDGLLTGGILAAIIREKKVKLSYLADAEVYPQYLINVAVKDKEMIHLSAIQNLATELKEQMAGVGRLLLRASGTENLIRIMAEHPDIKVAVEICRKLADKIKSCEEE